MEDILIVANYLNGQRIPYGTILDNPVIKANIDDFKKFEFSHRANTMVALLKSPFRFRNMVEIQMKRNDPSSVTQFYKHFLRAIDFILYDSSQQLSFLGTRIASSQQGCYQPSASFALLEPSDVVILKTKFGGLVDINSCG